MKYLNSLFLYSCLVGYFCLNSHLYAQDFWIPISSTGGIYGGNVTALAVDSQETLYAATWGGVYRSPDGGLSWVSVGFEDKVIQDIVVMENDDVYAAAGSAIYYSTDKGNSWTERNIPYSKGADALTISPDGRLFAGTMNGPYVLNPTTGTWENRAGSGTIVRDDGTMEIAVDSAGTIYSAFGYDAKETGGLYRSDDSGNTWLDITPPSGTRVVKVIKIDNKGRLWVGTGRGLYFSENKGSSWVRADGLPSATFISIGFAPDGTIYAGKMSSLYVSINDGQQWNRIFNKVVFDIEFFADGTVFAATDKGVFYSKNKGQSWVEGNFGMNNSFVFDIDFDTEGNLYIASSVGLYSSSDEGISFNLELDEYGGKDIKARTILMSENGDIFAGTAYDGIYYKRAGSTSWKKAYPYGDVMDIVEHPSGVLFAGTWSNGLYRSDDNGQSWQKTNLPGRLSARKLLVAADSGLFVGALKGDEDPWFIGYYYSKDTGETWTRTVFKEYCGRGQEIKAMLRHPNNDLYISTAFGIYQSKNNGENWDRIYRETVWFDNHNGEPVVVESFAVANDGQIFGGTNFGILNSADNGNTWKFLESTGLKNKRISCIKVSPSGYLYVGTIGTGASVVGGIFRSANKVVSLSNVKTETEISPFRFTLEQNYPNPFNPSTTIEFSIAQPGQVKLTVFDILGRKVRTLLDEIKPAGHHKVIFDGSGLSSGVYYYKLQFGNFAQTRKFLLVK